MATKAMRVRRVYVRRPRARHKAAMTIPVAVVAGFAPLAYETVKQFQANGLDGASQALVAYTTGYSRWESKWRFDYLLKGMGPVVAGVVVHKLAGKLGINRALARSGVPFLRI